MAESPNQSTIRSRRYMTVTIDRKFIFLLFKYTVYVLLSINIYVFFSIDLAAAELRFIDGVSIGSIINAYAASIDTAAWVILLLLFELETFALADIHFTRKVVWSMHGVRIFCYTFIIYAFYGYIANLLFVFGAAPLPELTDVCTLVGDGWAYAADVGNFVEITTSNCATFAGQASYLQLPNLNSIVGIDDYTTMEGLAWVDVINSAVWLLVVVILEMDVYLQERSLLKGPILIFSRIFKFILYTALLLAAIY